MSSRTTPLLARILQESNAPDLLEILAERLTPTDLQSLLLEVYRLRATRQTPARLLEQYEQNRFVRPSPVNPHTLLEFDRLALSLCTPAFEVVELAPVCPLGTVTAVASVSQNNTISTVRNTELVADSTNFLALECAVRRALLQTPQRSERVRLCASHRLLRAQHYQGPGAFAHFRLFALCTAGRDAGSYRFETETLAEQLAFYLCLLTNLQAKGYTFDRLKFALTDFDETHGASLHFGVLEPLAAQFPDVEIGFAPERTTGRGYYAGVCFHIHATDREGKDHLLVDGGFTDWTQQLLSNRKERLVISGIGSERVCSLFAPGTIDPS